MPVFIAAERPVADWLKPVADRPGIFRTAGVGKSRDVDFVPFYRLHRRVYGIYWDLFTPAGMGGERAGEIAAAEARQRRLEAATVGFAQPGEMQPERDANMQGEDTEAVRIQSRPGRRGSKWFSFDLPVDAAHPLALIVTYNHDEWQERTFDILVDGTPRWRANDRTPRSNEILRRRVSAAGRSREGQAEGQREIPSLQRQ